MWPSDVLLCINIVVVVVVMILFAIPATISISIWTIEGMWMPPPSPAGKRNIKNHDIIIIMIFNQL